MVLRIEAGERPTPASFESVRDPTGSPVVRYDSTISRKISRARPSSELRSEEGGKTIWGSR